MDLGCTPTEDVEFFFFYTDHLLQGFISHCSVKGYSSLLVATAEAEATTRTGRQHTHAHAHTHTLGYPDDAKCW